MPIQHHERQDEERIANVLRTGSGVHRIRKSRTVSRQERDSLSRMVLRLLMSGDAPNSNQWVAILLKDEVARAEVCNHILKEEAWLSLPQRMSLERMSNPVFIADPEDRTVSGSTNRVFFMTFDLAEGFVTNPTGVLVPDWPGLPHTNRDLLTAFFSKHARSFEAAAWAIVQGDDDTCSTEMKGSLWSI